MRTLTIALIAMGAFLLGWAYGLKTEPTIVHVPVVVAGPCQSDLPARSL